MTPKISNPDTLLAERPAEGRVLARELQTRSHHPHTVDRLRLLLLQRRFLARVTCAGLIATTIIVFLIPNRYTSTVRLMPPDNNSSSGLATMAAALGGIGALGDGLEGMAGEMFGLKSTSDIFVGILGSRTTQDKLVQQFGLQKFYGVRKMDDARKALAAHTAIDIDRKSQIITIGVTDKDPRKASEMAQAYVDELDLLVARLSTSSARRERIFLEGRLKGVNEDLEASERLFSQFASENTAIDIKEQGKAMVAATAALQGQLIATQSELEGLKQVYSDNNVRIRSLTARAAELKQQLDKLVGNGEGAELNATKPEPGTLYPSIRKLPLLGVTYEDLYRRTAVQEAIFETLTKEYEMAKVQEAKEIPTVKVLDAPNIPDKKTFPPRLLIMFFGTALSFSLAVLFVFGSIAWRAIDPADPGKLFAREVWVQVTGQRERVSDTVLRRIGTGLGWSEGSEADSE